MLSQGLLSSLAWWVGLLLWAPHSLSRNSRLMILWMLSLCMVPAAFGVASLLRFLILGLELTNTTAGVDSAQRHGLSLVKLKQSTCQQVMLLWQISVKSSSSSLGVVDCPWSFSVSCAPQKSYA